MDCSRKATPRTQQDLERFPSFLLRALWRLLTVRFLAEEAFKPAYYHLQRLLQVSAHLRTADFCPHYFDGRLNHEKGGYAQEKISSRLRLRASGVLSPLTLSSFGLSRIAVTECSPSTPTPRTLLSSWIHKKKAANRLQLTQTRRRPKPKRFSRMFSAGRLKDSPPDPALR